MKPTSFLTLTTLALAVSAVSTAHATSVNISTGLDASDNLITVGNTPDAHWTVAQPGPSGTSGPARVVDASSPGGAVGWAWAANGPASSWITIDPNNVAGNGLPLPTYYRPFYIAPTDLATTAMWGKWGIDDSGDLILNGNVVSSNPGDYAVATPFYVAPGSSFLHAGWNKLSIHMTFSDNFIEGVRLTGAVATVPEPQTYALLLAGLATVGAAARRRKPGGNAQ